MKPYAMRAACIVASAVLFLAGFFLLFRRRGRGESAPLDPLQRASRAVSEANAKAAVEIAIARTGDEIVRAELAAVLSDRDEGRRRRSLIALAKRTGL